MKCSVLNAKQKHLAGHKKVQGGRLNFVFFTLEPYL